MADPIEHDGPIGDDRKGEGQAQDGQQLPHETAEDRELSAESTGRGPVLPEPDNEQGPQVMHMPAAPTEQNPQVMFWPAPPNAHPGTMFGPGYASQRSLPGGYYEYPMQTAMPHTAYYPPILILSSTVNMPPLPFPTMNNPGQLYPTQQFQVTDDYHPQYVNPTMVPQNAIPQQFSLQDDYHPQPVNPYMVPPNSSIYPQQFPPPGAYRRQHVNHPIIKPPIPIPQQVPLPGAYYLRHVNPTMVPPNAFPQQFQLRGSYNPPPVPPNAMAQLPEREVGEGQAQEEREMQHENTDGKELPAESNEEMLVDTQPSDKLQSSQVLAMPAATTGQRTKITLSPDAPVFYPAKFAGPGFAPQQILPGAYHPNEIRWNEGMEIIRASVEYVPTTTVGEESSDRAEDSAEGGGDRVPVSAHTGDEQESPNTSRQLGRSVLRRKRAFVEYVPTPTNGEESSDRAPASAHTGDEQQSPNTSRQLERPVRRRKRKGAPKQIWVPVSAHTGDEQESPNTSRQLERPVRRRKREGAPKQIWVPKRKKQNWVPK